MTKPELMKLQIRVTLSPARPDEAREGAKFHAVAKLKLTPYGTVVGESCGATKVVARRFATAFALEALSKAMSDSAGDLDAIAMAKSRPNQHLDPQPPDHRRDLEAETAKRAFDGAIGAGWAP